MTPKPLTDKGITAVSSYTHAVTLGGAPVLIGERINPTGKKRFKEALRAGDMDYILREGIAEEECGAHILDVNVGLPDIDESAVLEKTVCALQEVTALPLQIDTADSTAMERALRRYNGKAMINSVSGKAESMAAVFPLAKKYGGVVVALTLDEQGIPATAEGRVEIAKRILAEAEKYGIAKKELVFDPLAMAVSADPLAAVETLRAVKMLHSLGCHTSLGVSNVSFGLPGREMLTASFFTLAMGQGLTCAIMNPHAADMMRAYHTYLALTGQDESFTKYIAFAERQPSPLAVVQQAPKTPEVAASELQGAIAKGLKERAAALTQALLLEKDPLSVVENEIIPALNTVGEGFEKKTVYLPGLLMSAEAAKAAFEVIKSKMQGGSATKCAVVLATVKGDIHDIGKNIVKLLLENYGFAVTDLGRDVLPEAVLETVVQLKAPLVGLSALMTTTVPAMAETVTMLRERAPWCRIMVGGAVLTGEYAAAIGADHYAKDAMAGVRYAEETFRALKDLK